MTNGFLYITNRVRGLALDVCAGAFCSAEMARKVLFPDASGLISTIIVCVVYVIYVSDHIFDYHVTVSSDKPYKYEWFKKALYSIVFSVFLVAGMVAVLVYKIYSPILLLFGIAMGLMVVGYYVLRILYKKGRISGYPKEWIIALLFTIGIWGYYLLSMPYFNKQTVVMVMGYFTSMLLNTYLFSYFERKEDTQQQHTLYGKHNTIISRQQRVQFTLIIVLGFLVNFIALLLNIKAGIILFTMFLYMVVLFIMKDRVKHSPYYGLITDLVLFIPLLYGLF